MAQSLLGEELIVLKSDQVEGFASGEGPTGSERHSMMIVSVASSRKGVSQFSRHARPQENEENAHGGERGLQNAGVV